MNAQSSIAKSAPSAQELAATLRVAYAEEHAQSIKDQLMGRQFPQQICDFVEGWLDTAADPQEHDIARAGVLAFGVKQVIGALGFAVQAQRQDTNTKLAHSFGARAQAFLEKVEQELPRMAGTMDRLLCIGEGEGQASPSVRLQATAAYISARAQFAHAGCKETPEQAERAMKLIKEFPQVHAMHAQINPKCLDA